MLGPMADHTTTDSEGQPVSAGTSVRVTHIHDSTVAPLSQLERDRVLSMLGEKFEVYEVDEWGQAWVEKWGASGFRVGSRPPRIQIKPRRPFAPADEA